MEPLNSEIVYTFNDTNARLERSSGGLPIASRSGLRITSYIQLLNKIAELQFYNRRFRLLFRGQRRDHNTPNITGEQSAFFRSSLYPSILRGENGKQKKKVIPKRYAILEKADEALKSIPSHREIYKHRLIRWAMLQHYDVCPTPLLDVTYSLDIALSFAVPSGETEGYLYVLAVPHTSGPISISLESGTQVVDLQQFCPPDILRPHFQNGCLIGDYPIIERMEDSAGGRGLIGNNFACRLLAKFQLSGANSWAQEGFWPKPSSILFPNDKDPWFEKMENIKLAINAQS